MLVYYLLLVGSLAIGIPLCRLKHGKKIYCGLAGAALFLVAAFREGVGFDYYPYTTWFYETTWRSEYELMGYGQEKGFLIPVKFLADATGNHQIMFVVIAAVITAAVMIYIYFYTEKAYISVFCFLAFGVFFNSMCFMRQMIAAAILLFAIRYIKKKQFFRFLALVLFASAFHISALVMVVFYFLLQVKMNWISFGVYSGALVLFLFFSEAAIEFVTQYFYTGYQLGAHPEITIGIGPVYAVFFGILFLLAFAVRKRLCEKDKFNNVFINIMFFVFFFEVMGAKHAVLSRFAGVFIIPAAIVLVPKVIEAYTELCREKFGKDRRKLIISQTAVLTAFAAFSTFVYSYMLVDNYNGVVPYQTVFTERG
ncbi:MAG: EpsG family protein [Oscillospiraceae bacterium]|nr:EpsG family protein [Oscillospiraceae bacterium]